MTEYQIQAMDRAGEHGEPIFRERGSEPLHKFLDAAAAEGLVLDGVDAADLYIAMFPERYAAAIAATPAPDAVAERFCNKCGYFGPDQLHQRPNGSGECGYLSMPTRAALKAAHPGERKEGE